MVLKRFLEGQGSGFYVDFVAHHPYGFSNTASLHESDWKGINIYPNPGTAALFDYYRPMT